MKIRFVYISRCCCTINDYLTIYKFLFSKKFFLFICKSLFFIRNRDFFVFDNVLSFFCYLRYFLNKFCALIIFAKSIIFLFYEIIKLFSFNFVIEYRFDFVFLVFVYQHYVFRFNNVNIFII